jgi:hypothetical protein
MLRYAGFQEVDFHFSEFPQINKEIMESMD